MIIAKPRSKPEKRFELLDIRGYIPGGIFKEAEFRAALRTEDWSRFQDKRILVKGCGRSPVPPWAYMLLLAHLSNHPRMVAYGEECAPIVVYRRKDVPEEELFITEENSPNIEAA